MIKGLFLSACVFLLLYVFYGELAPMVHNVIVRVDNTIARTTTVEPQTALHWFKIIALGALAIILAGDANAVLRRAIRPRKPVNPEHELGPRLREERARRRNLVETLPYSDPEEHRWV